MTSGLNKEKIQVVTNTNIHLQTIWDNKTSGDTLGAKKKKNHPQWCLVLKVKSLCKTVMKL